jgi:hypothetical protein
MILSPAAGLYLQGFESAAMMLEHQMNGDYVVGFQRFYMAHFPRLRLWAVGRNGKETKALGETQTLVSWKRASRGA